jgi:hypothetical protein
LENLSRVFCFWVWLKTFSCCLLHVLFSWYPFKGACFFIYIFWFCNFYSTAIVTMCGFYGSKFLLFYIFIVWLREHMLNIDIPPPKDVFHFHFLTIICHFPLMFFFSKTCSKLVNIYFHPISYSCMIHWKWCLYNYTTSCFATNIIFMNLIYFLPFVLL